MVNRRRGSNKMAMFTTTGMPSVHESFVNPVGDGSPTWTAAASKNPGDLDSAIDWGLLWPTLPPLHQQPARSFMGCLANSADPFHHDNLGCSAQGCAHGNTHGWHFKDFKIKFTQSFRKTHLEVLTKADIL